MAITKGQINWAKQHDWFSSADEDAGTITTYELWQFESGQLCGSYSVFSDFEELLAWAGY